LFLFILALPSFFFLVSRVSFQNNPDILSANQKRAKKKWKEEEAVCSLPSIGE
jgi:hypothetical protein